MKVIVIKAVALLSIAMLPLWLIAQNDNLDASSSSNHNIIKLQSRLACDDLDILFIGNSYCYSGIVPDLLDKKGINSFNLGIATAGPYFYDLIVRDYLGCAKRPPKFIFVLVSPMTFSAQADDFLSYPIHRYLKNPTTNENIAIKYFQIRNYAKIFRKSFEKGLEFIKNKTLLGSNTNFDVIKNRGWIPSEVVVTDEIIEQTKHYYYPLNDNDFNNRYLREFEKLLYKIQHGNTKVVLFEVPTNMLYRYFNEKYLQEYDKAIEKLSKEYTYIKIKDSGDSSHFRNIDHLNTAGSYYVTDELLHMIGKIPELSGPLGVNWHSMR